MKKEEDGGGSCFYVALLIIAMLAIMFRLGVLMDSVKALETEVKALKEAKRE